MANHPNRGLDAKLTKKLEDKKLYDLTYYAMSIGSGTFMMPTGTDNKSELDRTGIVLSLTDALREPQPTEWETEIGQLVLKSDTKKLSEICKQLQSDNPTECPSCRNTSRVRFRKFKKDFICHDCKFEWPKF